MTDDRSGARPEPRPANQRGAARLAAVQARVLSLLPNPPLSPDNLRSMQIDNLTDGARNYPDWNPKSLESIAPGYFAKVKVKTRLDGFRRHAGRAGN